MYTNCLRLQVTGTINGKTGLIPENYINFAGGV
jgi:hypothetical protein